MSLNSLRVQRVRARHTVPLRLNRDVYNKVREYNALDGKPKVPMLSMIKCAVRNYVTAVLASRERGRAVRSYLVCGRGRPRSRG